MCKQSAERKITLSTKVSEGLATLIVNSSCDLEGKQWQCNQTFLQLCGLRQDDLAQHVRKWWGNEPLWLDMLATEIGKGVGSRLELDRVLGCAWADDIDAWLKAAYTSAVTQMTSCPTAGIMATKASRIVREVLHRVTLDDSGSFVLPRIERLCCQKCQQHYLAVLPLCPGCSPPVSSAGSSGSAAAADDIQWQDLPTANVNDSCLDWSKPLGMHWCHGGSGGVTLLALQSGVVCLKKHCPMELLATKLSEGLGVRTARMQALLPGSPQKRAACKALTSFRPSEDDMQHAMHARKVSRAPILSSMEFIKGYVMVGLPAHQRLLSGKVSEVDRTSKVNEVDRTSIWYGLGRLSAFDLLINNFDRLPLAWSNEGNLGNIMLGSSDCAVVGIDQAVHTIHHADGLRNYQERVKRVVTALRSDSDEGLKGVKEAVYNNTAVIMATKEVTAFKSGALDFLHSVVRSKDFDATLEGAIKSTLDELRIERCISEATASEACEAQMMLEPLPRTMEQARGMISQVQCTVKEALA